MRRDNLSISGMYGRAGCCVADSGANTTLPASFRKENVVSCPQWGKEGHPDTWLLLVDVRLDALSSLQSISELVSSSPEKSPHTNNQGGEGLRQSKRSVAPGTSAILSLDYQHFSSVQAFTSSPRTSLVSSNGSPSPCRPGMGHLFYRGPPTCPSETMPSQPSSPPTSSG